MKDTNTSGTKPRASRGVKSSVRTPRPTMKARIGDWVMYTHKSEMVILGECVGKVENGVKVRDWLSDEIVNHRAIIEIRRRTKP